jgi:hypothetical protein
MKFIIYLLLSAVAFGFPLSSPKIALNSLPNTVLTNNYSTSVTINGNIKATKYYGDGSSLTGVSGGLTENYTASNGITLDSGITDGVGNSIKIRGTAGTGTGNGGSISITGGKGANSGALGGGILIQSGGASLGSTAGTVTISVGIGTGSPSTPGKISIIGGSAKDGAGNVIYGDIDIISYGNLNLSGNTILTGGFNTNGVVSASSFIANGTTLTVPDYVFEKDYKILSIKDAEAFINNNKHLPNVDPAPWKSLDLAKTNMKLLEKIEEAYIYIFELNKRLTKLENR